MLCKSLALQNLHLHFLRNQPKQTRTSNANEPLPQTLFISVRVMLQPAEGKCKGITHGRCTGCRSTRSWSSRRWSSPTAGCTHPCWRTNPPGM